MTEFRWAGVLRSCRVSAFALMALAMTGGVAGANGPESVADVAAKLSPSVVNISTSQKVVGQSPVPMPELPPGSPFRDFFEDLFKDQPGGDPGAPARKVNSLGSGFIVDPAGLIVTNNHVIEAPTRSRSIFADGSDAQGQAGRPRRPRPTWRCCRSKPTSRCTAVKFGDSDKCGSATG